MSKKYHLLQKLRVLQHVFQNKLIPRSIPHLTPAESHGPEFERFKDQSQSIVAWNDKKNQTWKFKGSLRSNKDRVFGFQLSFSKHQTQDDHIGPFSAHWLVPEIYSAFFSITDFKNALKEKTFRYWQRGGVKSYFSHALRARTPLVKTARTGFASEERFHVEVGGWYAMQSEGAMGASPLQLYASEADCSLHLTLEAVKPLVYHGQSGFAQTDQENSFYSCSYPRLVAKGNLYIDGNLESVEGTVWFTHEKSSQQNVSEKIFLHFNDGSDLVVYNTPDSRFATFIGDQAKHIVQDEIQLDNTEYWVSPETSARYPVKRRLKIDSLGLDVELKALARDQELDASKTLLCSFWNGLISADGKYHNDANSSMGYMELNGFDPRGRAKLSRLFDFN